MFAASSPDRAKCLKNHLPKLNDRVEERYIIERPYLLASRLERLSQHRLRVSKVEAELEALLDRVDRDYALISP